MIEPIIVNPVVFNDSFVPDVLPCREKHLKIFKDELGQFSSNYSAQNMLFYGPSGSGKTAVTLLGIKQHKKAFLSSNVKIFYVNCNIANTSYRVLNRLCKMAGLNVPDLGLPFDTLYERFLEKMNSEGLPFMVVLDEVDLLIRRSGDSILYSLLELNSSYEGSVSLVGVSNTLEFMSRISQRVISRFNPRQVFYPEYNALELFSILEQRARLGLREDSWDPAALRLIAAIVAKECGDARRAIDLLRISSKLAEQRGESKLLEFHVRLAAQYEESERLKIIVKTLSPHQAMVLDAIAILKYKRELRITTGKIYQLYVKLCDARGLTPLTLRRVLDIVRVLEEKGLLSTWMTYGGRAGNARTIRSLNLSVYEILDVLRRMGYPILL